MQIPDLNLLVALNILLEEGSVTGAARRMNLSAPAMSRTLTRIREALNDPILVRSGRGLVPTPRALELREQVRGVVELAHGVFTPGQETDLSSLERTFSVRANDMFFGAYGGQLLKHLARHMPNATLRMVPEGDTDDDAFNEGRIDLAVCATRKFGADIKVQRLFNSSLVGIAREGHPLFDEELDVERFVKYDHISVSRRGRARGPIDTLLDELNLQRRISLVLPTFHSAMFAVAASDLILPSIPRLMINNLSGLGLRLRTFELPLPVETIVMVQAWHPRLDNDHAHRWLRRSLKDMCSSGD
ncbi:LysR family transcriptional regulator [Pseudomonas gingeri]|uniref:LysR family transcriptional regulator n=1 Tax=Pseudomonas gingeri TaxID=117681 RepID=A0A7Y7X994_9PSED|nr:LysR family transcriptional regulator [Pseudomonas gingeri]NWB95604.1 LysR family transcriptional regulator [Pseudomonas gingeri]NWD76043.1 LysR family transcriptional regulator [Pseudomonas gingeri]